MYGAFKFHFVGTCAADPEHSKLRNGQDRCVINVAVNTPIKKDDGKYEERTTWVRVAFFGQAALRKSLDWCTKGTPVYCEGTVQSYTEETPDKKYTMYNFRPDVIRPLGQRPQPRSEPEDPQSSDDELPDAFS